MRPKVLLLMPATTYRAADFVEAALRLGVEVAVAADQRQTLEEQAPGGVLSLDFGDPQEAVRRIRAFAQDHPVSAVVGVEDDTALTAALVGEELGLPHNPSESIRTTRDKHRMRECLARAGLPGPEFRRCRAHADPRTISSQIRYPCVVKPLALAGSRGVIRADDPPSFEAAFHRVRELLAEEEVSRKGAEAAQWILVESYIPGREVALEGLLVRGSLKVLALFDKPDPMEGPYFEETIYVTPSRLPTSTQEAIRECMDRASSAVGLREGPIHAEARINEEGVWPLEVAARSIGGLCSRTLRFGTGVSLEELILLHALGKPVAELERDRQPAGVMMIPISRRGVLRQFEGEEEAAAVPGIESVTRTISLGQTVVPLPEGSRYVGFIFARAGTPEAVEASLRKAHLRLRIRIDPE